MTAVWDTLDKYLPMGWLLVVTIVLSAMTTHRVTGHAMHDAWHPEDLHMCYDCRIAVARCGECFYRPSPFASPHRPGWRYRCWLHRALAFVHAIPQGPEGGL